MVSMFINLEMYQQGVVAQVATSTLQVKNTEHPLLTKDMPEI